MAPVHARPHPAQFWVTPWNLVEHVDTVAWDVDVSAVGTLLSTQVGVPPLNKFLLGSGALGFPGD